MKQKHLDLAIFLLRIVSGYLFMLYGGMKMFGWFGAPGWNELPTLMHAAGVLEFFGGLIILAGFWIRPVAFILAGEMAVAYFMAHAMQGYWYAPVVNDGTASVLFCFIFLFFTAYGAGKWSLGRNR